MSDRKQPSEFDGYRLVRMLGKGGMGEVYLAEDTLLERQVAIKFIASPDSATEAHKRFMLEARAIARLQHPNVVSIYRVGEVEGRSYLVSEYIRGKPLDTIATPVAFTQIIRIASNIACGLAAAHRRGVVHRDIKPANAVLSEDGEVKLLDFGIAKLLQVGQQAQDQPEQTSARQHQLENQPTINALEIKTFSGTLQGDLALAQTMLTFPGAIMGTPSYMAPEVLNGEPATFRSDVYSFGALLYYLCSGRPPHSGNSVAELWSKVTNQDASPLSTIVENIDPDFCAFVDRCLKRDPGSRYATGNEVRAALMQFTPEARRSILPEGNPYRGLHAFEMEHQNLFFGRDSQIRMVLERLTVEPFVLVAGDSGVGKSSLCRAGVLPRVDSWFDKKRSWSVVMLMPGKHPITSLSAVLAKHLNQEMGEVTRAFFEDPSGVVRKLQAQQADKHGLVVFIDQMEELVTHAAPDEQAVMSEIISWLATPLPGLRLLATIRGDFLSRLDGKLQLSDELSRALYFLRSLSPERVRETIVGPAQAKGVSFSSNQLVDKLASSSMEADGGLPLLQFALAELWETRDKSKQTISEADLESIGGVSGALSRHADNVLAQMMPEERKVARQLLLQLVMAEGTRARKSEAELNTRDTHVAAALDALIRGRLVVARDTPEGVCYEIAHEVLITGWTSLARWLSADAGAKIIRERLQTAVAEWERLGRSQEALWSMRQVAEVADLKAPSDREGCFLQASRRAYKRRRFVRISLLVGFPLVVALIYGGTRLKARFELTQRMDELAKSTSELLEHIRRDHSQASQLRRAAMNLFDQQKEQAAEQVWSEHLKLTNKLKPEYSQASQQLETALMLDPNRADVRDLFAEVLYQRALLAEKQHNQIERDELAQRLSLYDQANHWSSKLQAPGSVTIATYPGNATIELWQYVLGPQNSYQTQPIQPPSDWSGKLSLAQGSYLAVLEASGFTRVRAPFIIRRGEHLDMEIKLPRLEDVPIGFVYIPPGRFLFGSAAEESQRKEFFHAVPLHQIDSPGYLIARHETTFAQWIEFLSDLSPDQRRKHYPRVEKGGFQGSLSLQELPGGSWKLTFQPTSKTYTAVAGEKITYPGRSKRRSQDWLKFPVFGISVSEAESYTKWLDTTNRVKGAHLCIEHEWERAARGADGREYPHGITLNPEQANYDDTYGKIPLAMGPDQVGSYPLSISPFELFDMAGNVWEWTRSSVTPGKYTARGGSYYFGLNSCRTTDREETEPSFRDVSVGFRVCADYDPASRTQPPVPP